ncbi:MAG: hypothetical protein JNK46_04460 [Methylobacteriaceae bacterium]|nr:hypothetical protein [Methylobacteriaceae bacterium]
MWRAVLESAALFVTPFVAYALYLVALRRYPFAVEHWTKGALALLLVAGLVVAIVGTFLLGLRAERHYGGYVPAHMENGKLVPGRWID